LSFVFEAYKICVHLCSSVSNKYLVAALPR
jgi:hypothetical protein